MTSEIPSKKGRITEEGGKEGRASEEERGKKREEGKKGREGERKGVKEEILLYSLYSTATQISSSETYCSHSISITQLVLVT